ncbi:MAG: phosphomannomutase/phosphoglucomutase [Candidatus Shapirobacteria bacterium]|nr:phosphomannomutase/phosphoglucomutase [Candidatus Shapirobacteria bacterium]MDD5481700.1 phosphomannomutase/phosphoglucomutase [Candidatus Shapirobacteria bacterium]
MDPKIFSAYDIRGVYPGQWNKEDAYLIGQGFGTFFSKKGVSSVCLGQDNRLSGSEITKQIIQGLVKTGQRVTFLGTITTPMTYFSWYHYQAPATMMITASHNPAEYNGIKSALNKNIIYGDQLQSVLKIVQNKDFINQSGGQVINRSIADDYIAHITKDIKLKKPPKILIDTGNGAAGLFARRVFEKVACQTKILFEKSDGSFPNHPAYPQKEEFYSQLKENLKMGNFDLGLAFDGDGDRIGVYSPEGNFIENDITAAILAKSICQNHPKAKVVLNISTTMAVLETIQANGGQPILWKTGFPLITEKMRQEKAIFGGEISGHFFFSDRYFGYDDAFYAALRLLEIITQGPNINQLANELPQYHQIPEFRLELPSGVNKYQIGQKIAAQIKSDYPKAQILDIDGVRFSFENAWGLLRPSNTEPLLSGRAEGKTKKDLEKVKKIINDQLEKHHFSQKI